MAWQQWLTKLFERRDSWQLSELQDWSTITGAAPLAAGMSVTPETASQVPSVYACTSVISQDVAKTGLKFRKRVAVDTFEDAREHDLYEILSTLPNPETTAYSFKRSMMQDLLYFEHAYAQIVRQDGRVTALWRLDPTRMTVERDGQRRKVYRYRLPDGGLQSWTFDASMPPILDLAHPSPVQQCRELIGTALALQTYTAKFFAHGGRPSGVLKAAGAVNPEQLQRLRTSWEAIHGAPGKAHKLALLEGGLDYQTIASANDEAQLNETLRTITSQIAAAFRVPTWRVGDMTGANYSNMETSERAYVSDCLDPFFTCWEEAIRRDLLTSRQYNAYSVTFDRSSLIRSDTQSLHTALATARQNGWMSPNDIRRKLGENPISKADGGDDYLVNTALGPVREQDAGKEQSV